MIAQHQERQREALQRPAQAAEVLVLEDGALEQHGQIAALLRF